MADRLTPLDASFLHTETASAHMHVAWRGRFRPDAARPAITLARVQAQVASRLDSAPRFRRRLAFPGGWAEFIAHPVWVDAEHFNVRRHVVALGGDDQPLSQARFDALADMEAIRAETAAFKGTGRAGGGEALLQGLGLLPLPLQAPLARLAASPRMYNLVVSNVPGPRMPVYLLGAECIEVLPAIPLSDGHALSVGVFSLRDRLCFGAYADPEALPQARELPGAVGVAADELIRASDVRAPLRLVA